MREELQLRVIKLIGLFDYLISIEKNPGVFITIKKKYQSLLLALNNDQIALNSGLFDVIQSVGKMMYDTPTNNISLGKYILDQMQEIYIISKKVEEH